jgi:hypothetical protein
LPHIVRINDCECGALHEGIEMRIILGALMALASAAAFAAEAEGEIQTIDPENLTITLDDGKSYKLPGEFDISAIEEGMEILIAYDEVGGVNLITDMALSE